MNKFIIDTSWDDGHQGDMMLACLLKRYGIPATFYIPNCSGLSTEDIRELSEDFEIGGHTVNHYTDLKKLEDEVLEIEIEDNKEWLEMIVGRKITRFCYPKGRYDERVIGAVRKAGYTSARTAVVLSTEHQADPFRARTTIQAYSRAEYKGEDWLELAKDYFMKAKEDSGCFHLWGHFHDIWRHEFGKLIDLFEFMSKNK